jgi:hypothetical protein
MLAGNGMEITKILDDNDNKICSTASLIHYTGAISYLG